MISIRNCPICSATNIKHVFNCTDYTASNKQFEIKECLSCSFRFTSPRPSDEELGQYYLSDNYISHSNNAKKFTDRLYRVARNYTLRWKKTLINDLQTDKSKKRLLDYGCGTGAFLQHMNQSGWDVQGLEPSAQARQTAESLIGKELFKDIEEIQQGQFDVITLWHVLEHVPLLHETVAKLKALLSPQGMFVIAVPNHKSLEEKKFGSNWAGYDVPRHLWHFNQPTIKALMSQHGLKIAHTIPMKLDAYYISLLSERYVNHNRPSILHLPKAVMMGLQSNLAARKDNEYSSLIYIVTK